MESWNQRLSLAEIQRLRGWNEITTRDRIEASMRAIQLSWATVERARRILEDGDRDRDRRTVDELAWQLTNATLRAARSGDNGSFLAMIADPRAARK